jgi:hypothetical protein
MAVLQDVSKTNGKAPATADLLAQIEALKADNERLKQARNSKLSLKVSAKGAVSLYGCGRFPVTLYSGQWERVLAMGDQIKALIEANKTWRTPLSKASRRACSRSLDCLGDVQRQPAGHQGVISCAAGTKSGTSRSNGAWTNKNPLSNVANLMNADI